MLSLRFCIRQLYMSCGRLWRTVGICRLYQTDLQDTTNPANRRVKRPTGLEGTNWRDLRKRQRLGHDRWRPMKRLTHDQMDHLRHLGQMQPDEWTNEKLAETFGISVSSVVRILKSKFEAPANVRARQDAKARRQRDERREKFYRELNMERTTKENVGIEHKHS